MENNFKTYGIQVVLLVQAMYTLARENYSVDVIK